jgi:hypothetical protein
VKLILLTHVLHKAIDEREHGCVAELSPALCCCCSFLWGLQQQLPHTVGCIRVYQE